MNRIFKSLAATLMLVFVLAFGANAQSTGSASLSAGLLVTLKGDLSPSRYYVPYGAVAFRDVSVAQHFGSIIDDNLLDFEFSKEQDYPNGFFLKLKKENAPAEWTLTQWNDYLATKQEYFSQLFNRLNNE
jgi:hypothetical protein